MPIDAFEKAGPNGRLQPRREAAGYPGVGDEGAGGGGPKWSRLAHYGRRLWWIPVLTVVLGLCGRVAYQAMQPPSYVSSARMTLGGTVRVSENSVYSEELSYFFGTQVELMRSSGLQQRALERLQAQEPGLAVAPVQVQARQTPKAALFDLSVVSPDARFAPRFLDALMDEYLNYRKEMRADASDNTLASVSERLFEQEKELRAAQDRLSAFQRDNNLSLFQEQSASVASYLGRLTAQYSDLKLELSLAEAGGVPAAPGEAAGTQGSARGDADRAPAGTAAPGEFQAARQQLKVLRLQREEFARVLRPKHPKMVKLDEEIARSESLLGVMRDLASDQSREESEALRRQLRTRATILEAAIHEWEGKLNTANARLAEAERLKSDVARIQGLYERLNGLVQNVDLGKDLSSMNLMVMERAGPAVPAALNTPGQLVMAGVLGLFAGLALVALVAQFDDRFSSLDEVQERFAEEVLGQIPEVAGRGADGRVRLVTSRDDRHMFTESCRSLRSSLLFQRTEGRPPKLLLVTSAVPGEGKSTIASNTACTLALGGARVLLIDGDIRKGTQHAAFDVERDPGLTHYLEAAAGAVAFADIIRPTSIPKLSVIPTGPLVRTHAEYFLSERFDALLAHARANYDYVIIDSAPVFAADDATTLAPKTDGVLFVVRSSYSRSRASREALEALYQRQVNVLGLVVNRLNPRRGSYQYYKYGEYSAVESGGHGGRNGNGSGNGDGNGNGNGNGNGKDRTRAAAARRNGAASRPVGEVAPPVAARG